MVLVTFEGIDGSGKGVQAGLLAKRLASTGVPVELFSFPQYGTNPFAEVVSDYLNGRLGQMKDVHPKLASLLYACDRYTTADTLQRMLAMRTHVVCDRYVESNMAHQGARVPKEDRQAFWKWLDSVEYRAFNLPSPDLIILLDIQPELAQQRVQAKGKRTYTGLAADLHEADRSYLAEVADCYRDLAKSSDSRWRKVSNVDASGAPRPAEEIASECWEAVRALMVAQDPQGS